MRDAKIGLGIDRMREEGRFGNNSEASYYDSERKVRLRKLIDGRSSYQTLNNDNY